jgi:hypothetical protein
MACRVHHCGGVIHTVLALLLAAPVAGERPVPPKVGVLAVVGGTGLREADRDHLRTRSRAAMLGPDVRMADDEELAKAQSCENQACRQRSLAPHGVTYWLTIEIDGRDRMYSVQTTLWSALADQPVAETKERCVVCGRVELAELVAAQALTMRRFVSETADDPAAFVVDARPRGARVEIDGREVGKGHVRAMVAPGEHRIRVSARGYVPQELTLSVTHGVTRAVEVSLLHPEGPGRWHRPLAIGAVAAAAASIGVGAGLLAADGRPVRRRCGSDDPQNLDAEGDCRYVRQTLGAGVVMTALGVGLASAATTLLVIDAGRRRRRSEVPVVRLRLQVTPSRVGLAGTF